ncbi:MAG: hypothetical protein K0R84_2404 [Clostridia bacterium]|jgi:hypothetical protein|nr:hypothetical protein [Clostridia bacterium]
MLTDFQTSLLIPLETIKTNVKIRLMPDFYLE